MFRTTGLIVGSVFLIGFGVAIATGYFLSQATKKYAHEDAVRLVPSAEKASFDDGDGYMWLDVQDVFFTFAIPNLDNESFRTHDSERGFENPDAPEHYFWGLHFTNYEAVRLFLSNRALKCYSVFVDENVSAVDCYASPERGKAGLLQGESGSQHWISLFKWLPEFGWAERRCSDKIPGHKVIFEQQSISYNCWVLVKWPHIFGQFCSFAKVYRV